MSLETTASRVIYSGNGSTKVFSFSFKVWEPSQVRVKLADSEGAETDVTSQVVVALTATGGTVTFGTAPADGTTLAILRSMPFVQEDRYITGTRFDPHEIEDALDIACAERQELREQLGRAVKIQPTSSGAPDDLVRDLFNARAEAVSAAGEARQAEQDVKAWPGKAEVTATGATTPRALQDRFADVVNVKDFGAVGDGVTDDTYAIQLAFDTGKTVYIPQGVYVCTQELILNTTGQRIVGAGMGGAYPAQGYPFYATWRDCTTLLFKTPNESTPDPVSGRGFTARRVRTRYGYRGSCKDPKDAPMSVCVNVQSDCVQIEHIAIRNDVRLPPFSEWRNNAEEANNFGADWDVGLFVGTQPALTLDSVAVLGSHRMANIWVDSTQEGYSAKRFENWRTGQEFFGSQYGLSQFSNNNANILGNDKTLFNNVWTSGGLWGIRIEGAHLPQDDGRTEIVNASDERLYYDGAYDPSGEDVEDSFYVDNRGLFGCSDLCLLSCLVYGGDHHTLRRIVDFYAEDYVDQDAYVHCGGAMTVNGYVGNSSNAVHDHQYINCRFHGYGPYTIRLGRTNRDRFFGCETEQRAYYTHDGEAIDVNVPNNAFGNLCRSVNCGSTQLIAVRISYDSVYGHMTGDKDVVLGDYATSNDYIGDNLGIKGVIKKTVDNEQLSLYGATAQNRGAVIHLYGGDVEGPHAGACRIVVSGAVTDGVRPQQEVHIHPVYGMYPDTSEAVDLGTLNHKWGRLCTSVIRTSAVAASSPFFSADSDATTRLGVASARWAELFAATAAINTSDAREKTLVVSPDEALMRAWGKVNFRAFKFTDAVEKKGEDARIHFGVIAQQVQEAFASEGLDASHYALFCYDKWEDEYEDVEVVDVEAVLDDDGNEVTPAVTHTEKRLVTPAGDRYGIRYSEALALECAYQRWRLDKLEAKLNAAD